MGLIKEKKESANLKIGHLNYPIRGMKWKKKKKERLREPKGLIVYQKQTNMCIMGFQK